MHSKFEAKKTAWDRCMEINSNDPTNEMDVLSYFDKNATLPNPIFCTMMRIVPGKDVHQINDMLLQKETFSMEDIAEEYVSDKLVRKSHYYYAVSDNYLVTNLPGNITITRLQTYLNWFLDSLYEIVPCLEAKKIQELGNIRDIKFEDPFMLTNDEKVSEKTSVAKLGILNLVKILKIA